MRLNPDAKSEREKDAEVAKRHYEWRLDVISNRVRDDVEEVGPSTYGERKTKIESDADIYRQYVNAVFYLANSQPLAASKCRSEGQRLDHKNLRFIHGPTPSCN